MSDVNGYEVASVLRGFEYPPDAGREFTINLGLLDALHELDIVVRFGKLPKTGGEADRNIRERNFQDYVGWVEAAEDYSMTNAKGQM